MTEEIKHDLKVLKYRDVIDGKTFYKSDNSRKLPKHFQIGRVVDDKTDYYSNRISKKQKKMSLADELLEGVHKDQTRKRRLQDVYAKQKNRGGNKRSKKNRVFLPEHQ